MSSERIRDRQTLHKFFKQNPYLYLYCIGDLEEYFWPNTKWFGWREKRTLKAVLLIYTGLQATVVLALADDEEAMSQLVLDVNKELPDQFYAHMSPKVEPAFAKAFSVTEHGKLFKMGLLHPEKLAQIDTSGTFSLTRADETAVSHLYTTSYPGNWFEPSMLDIGHYYGIRQNGELAAIAGVHVYSANYKVAALGGITTHPDHRGKGLAQKVTARLCNELLETCTHIGLNVNRGNETAVSVYKKLGFEPVATYGEFQLERK